MPWLLQCSCSSHRANQLSWIYCAAFPGPGFRFSSQSIPALSQGAKLFPIILHVVLLIVHKSKDVHLMSTMKYNKRLTMGWQDASCSQQSTVNRLFSFDWIHADFRCMRLESEAQEVLVWKESYQGLWRIYAKLLRIKIKWGISCANFTGAQVRGQIIAHLVWVLIYFVENIVTY